MANDVLSDEQIANLIDAYGSPHEWADKEVAVALRELQHRRAQENSSLPGTLAAVQAQPVSHAPLHKMSCLSMKGSRLNGDPFPCDCPASEAQPVSAEPKCPQCGWVNFEHEKGCSRSVSARPDPAWMQAQRAIQERDATGSHPLRDETREPDTAGREEWQPIETAPKDGTRVLVWWEHWSAYPVVSYFKHGRWNGEIACSEGDEQPTHWQPLPEPPAALQRARESAQGKTR
jgi:hypothetical protein